LYTAFVGLWLTSPKFISGRSTVTVRNLIRGYSGSHGDHGFHGLGLWRQPVSAALG